jgi:predicted component of type VI protein secretion system
LFEPRILGVQVTVDRPRDSKELRFRISGRLKMKPRPEPIHYDTMLDVKSGEYAVEVPGEVHA